MTIYRLSLVAALAGSLALTACAGRENAEAASAQQSNRKPAPDFKLQDASGATVKLSDYRGKVVVLDFWATWCGPCKIEIPWFMEFEKTLKDRGFAVLGVSMDDDGWNVVKPYIQERGVNYRILLGNDQVGQAYGGVDSLPTTFLIDRSGRIASVHVGLSSSKEQLKDEILALLNARASRRLAPAGLPAFLSAPGAN